MLKNIEIKEYFFLPVILLFIFYLYLISLFPAYKSNDSPEIAAASYTLGICHPPGYPFYINLSKIFSLIPIGNIAFRLNIMSSILAILTIFCTYFILKNISKLLLKVENKLYSIFSIFLLAFSYIFWNQAIEVKGGIYILNLLFLSLIIFLFIQLIVDFKIIYLYLLIYVYAISLTNHWQSMIILLPWILFLVWYFKKRFNTLNILYFIGFFILGLSVYTFLIIRGITMPVVNWGNTSDVKGFFEFIIRKPYFAETTVFTIENLIRNIKVFAELFSENYWFLWIFCLPGIYILFKTNKFICFSFIYIIFIVFFTVVFFYARNILEVPWLLKIFFMPVEYVILFLISLGIFYIFAKYKFFLSLLLMIIIFFYIKNNITDNYRTKDFFSYDIAFNLFNTIKEDAFYFTERDMFFFPVLYEQIVNKKRRDIKLIPLPFLQSRWWAKEIEKKYGYVNISGENIINNYYEFINQTLNNHKVIYREFSSDLFEKILKIEYITGFAGLLKTISSEKQSESPLIYQLYSFRGLYSYVAQTDENSEIVARYLIFSALHAEKLMSEGRYSEAIELFKLALRIPTQKFDFKIYYNLAMCYNAIHDNTNEIIYLNKCILSKPDYAPAHERLGLYYYEKGFMKEARIFIENAIKYGSSNKKIIDLYNNL